MVQKNCHPDWTGFAATLRRRQLRVLLSSRKQHEVRQRHQPLQEIGERSAVEGPAVSFHAYAIA